MKRLLSFLIIAGVVAFAGFKAGVWWLTDQRMAEARTALSDYGVLERGRIGSALDGRVILKQSSWQNFRLTQSLELGLLEFDAGSPLALLTTLATPAPLPANWQLMVEQASMALDPTMFRNWVTAGVEAESRLPPLVALACAPDPRQQLGSGDLMRIGISAIRGELVLEQRVRGVRAELNTAATGSLELDWPGARIHLSGLAATLSSSAEPVSITFRDAGLMRRLSAYCARETGLAVSQWAGNAVSALETGLQARGYQGSDQLLALYRQWLMEGGELIMAIQPGSATLGIPVRADSEPASAWSLSYNGAGVPDIYLTGIAVPVPQLPLEAMQPVLPREEPGVQQWYAEELDTAQTWIGRQVRVTLSNDNQVEGRLVRVGERELEISRTVAGGEVSYPIRIRAIRQFGVWRRGRPD
ncbi:MAG: acetylornithine deacetylase [Marinobacter sp.]